MNEQDQLAASKKMLLALKKMKERVKELESAKKEPIAIIGMSCRFPGSKNCKEYWNILENGIDTINVVPKERWDINKYYDPNPDVPGKMYTKYGGFVDNVDEFDAPFFGISPREAISMDPQHRIFLEVAWEALEHARKISPQLRKSKTGVFVGASTNDYSHFFLGNNDPSLIDAYFGTGNAHSAIAGRISYLLGLQGPSFSVDTACSSSLVAIHLACQSLRNRESEMAIAGGVNLTLIPITTINFCKARMMAPDGRCKTFDEAADGYVRGEGCGIVVLKRLSDALKDRDNILAVIRGSAVNQDGPSGGLTAPNGPSQEAVILSALENGNIQPEDVDYVEAHGTGTSLGDPIEVQALANALRNSGGSALKIGSVKTNIGHLEAAAGIAGIIKLVLSLQNEQIPQHLHFKNPSSYISWNDLAVEVVKEKTSWKKSAKERIAGVSSFGFIGTNAHIILSEAPSIEHEENKSDRAHHIITLSAKNKVSLNYAIHNIHNDMKTIETEQIADYCYTINSGKGHFTNRIALCGATKNDFLQTLELVVAQEKPHNVVFSNEVTSNKVAFLFTGQGSQYIDMGKELYETSPVFRKNMDTCNKILQENLNYSILDYIYPQTEENKSFIDQTAYTQPALFCIEYSLAQMWRSWGIEPDIVIGHSIGEYVAACIANVFDLESGLKLLAKRAQLMQSLPSGTTMISIADTEDVVHKMINSNNLPIDIAAINGHKATVVGGKEEDLQKLEKILEAEKISAKRLSVSHAFHSRYMDSILEEFEKFAQTISYHSPEIAIISNVTGKIAEQETISQSSYWSKHIRNTVQFIEGINTLVSKNINIFLEIGVHPTLMLLGQNICENKNNLWVSSLRKGKKDWEQLLLNLGKIYCKGVDVDFRGFDKDYIRYTLDTPTYPFNRQKYWVKTKPRITAEDKWHPFIDFRIASPALKDTIFQTSMSIEAWPEVEDHKVHDMVVMPGSAYLEMALAVQKHTTNQMALKDVVIMEPLILAGESYVQVISSGAQYSIYSSADQKQWKLHSTGKYTTQSQNNNTIDLVDLQKKCHLKVEIAELYSSLANLGLQYGEAFQCIKQISHNDKGEVLARIVGNNNNGFHLDPCVLDACFQAFSLCIIGENKKSAVYIPVAVNSYSLQQQNVKEFWVHANLSTSTENVFSGNLLLFDLEGEIIAEIEGLHIKSIAKQTLLQSLGKTDDNALFETCWEEVELTENKTSKVAIIFSENHDISFAENNYFVVPGTENKQQDNVYTIVPEEKESYSWLWQNIAQVTDETIQIVYMSEQQKDNIVEAVFESSNQFLHLIQSLQENQLTKKVILNILTTNAQYHHATNNDVNLKDSPLWAMGRVIFQEYPELSCTIIDVDNLQNKNIIKALNSHNEKQLVLREENIYGLRLQPLQNKSLEIAQSEYKLTIDNKGSLENLYFTTSNRRELDVEEIEIEVVATGLNFRDVMNTLGLYPGDAGELGGECSGRVARVGKNVTQFREGDSVIAIASGSFANFAYTNVALAVKKPNNINFIEAATIPITFLTAYYGLHKVAQVASTQKVLIHSAAGGVGLAAIQIAKLYNAQVFTTAGNDEKRNFLRSLGVEHIFDSRSLHFKEEIDAISDNIDIVLNALAGEYIPKSMALLKNQGHFLEIGKTDIWSQQKVKTEYPNVNYCAFDLAQICAEQPQLIQSMFSELMSYFEQGKLTPLHCKTFSYRNIIDAFRYMAQAKHIGKIVIEYPPQKHIITNSSYFITGGLGALGLEFAEFLACEGAKNIILASRKTNVPQEAANKIKTIQENYQTQIKVVTVDVSDYNSLKTAWSNISQEIAPLKGIIHAAGVLQDQLIANLTPENLQLVLKPKVDGAYNLYRLIQDFALDLDFVAMFSSIASVLGAVGQTNYAIANNFLDTFIHILRKENIPAISINWGPWAELGMAVDSAKNQSIWSHLGIQMIEKENGKQLFANILNNKNSQVIAMPLDIDKFAQKYGNEPLFSKITQKSLVQNVAKSQLIEDLEAAPINKKRTILSKYVHSKTAQILGTDKLETTQPLQELGLDSIMAVEVKNTLEMALGKSLPATMLFNYPTLDAIVNYLANDILELEGDENQVTKKDTIKQENKAQREAEVEDMSDEEAMELLNQKLNLMDDED